MVPRERLELSQGFPYQILSLARLPISPPRRALRSIRNPSRRRKPLTSRLGSQNGTPGLCLPLVIGDKLCSLARPKLGGSFRSPLFGRGKYRHNIDVFAVRGVNMTPAFSQPS